jgi:hypothetical protein
MLCVSGALLGLSFLDPGASYAEIVRPLGRAGGGRRAVPPTQQQRHSQQCPRSISALPTASYRRRETSDRRSGRRSRRRFSPRDSDRRGRRRHWRDLSVRSLAGPPGGLSSGTAVRFSAGCRARVGRCYDFGTPRRRGPGCFAGEPGSCVADAIHQK